MSNVQASNSSSSVKPARIPKGASKRKKGNSMGHTAKEKYRRAHIVDSCNIFRELVPIAKVSTDIRIENRVSLSFDRKCSDCFIFADVPHDSINSHCMHSV